MKKIALIGSTGSIGGQVLEVVSEHPDKFKITALTANRNYKRLEEQMWRYKPVIAGLSDAETAKNIKNIPQNTSFYYGENAITHAIMSDCDLVFVAVTGYVGFEAVVSAIESGKSVALANKEALVVGGEYVTKLAKEKGVKIIPVDSEHSAIWQALDFDFEKPFSRLIITASGGAFRDLPPEKLESVTAEDALRHPNWKMGDKITIDCATMVNKAFEVAEAKWLFNADLDKIEVCIHRESVVHSMVEFFDGAIIAQMASPDMKLPIQLALTYPERIQSDVRPIDFTFLTLTFKTPDYERYPCFSLVIEAIKRGKNYPCAVSAADEVAVNLFLQGLIKFTDIYGFLEDAFKNVRELEATPENLRTTDAWARSRAIGRFNTLFKRS